MADETPVAPSVPPVPAPPVVVSTIQAVSATVQNVVVAAVIAYAWLIAGKLDTSVALGSLFAIVGIDFANRAHATVNRASALAFGSTGVLSALMGRTVLAFALAAGLASCGAGATVDLKPYRTAIVTSRDVYQILCVPAPETQAAIDRCTVARVAVDVGIAAYNEIEKLAEADAAPSDAGAP